MSTDERSVDAVRTTASLSCLFIVGLMIFLYSGYPFDGMIISDSWYWYLYDAGDFRWPESAIAAEGELQPQPYTPNWSALMTRRGFMPILVMAIDHLVVGDKRVFLNLLCILVLGANLGLFGYIVWRLAGVRLLFPALLAAALYPFASGSHFWQHLILNNLAATFFLLSLALFLSLRSVCSYSARAVAVAALSLVCYWLSILTVDYAIFMSPLYLYLALYYTNGGKLLIRFRRWASPYAGLGALFIVLTLLAGVLLSRDAPTFLIYSERTGELAARVGLPVEVVAPLTVVINGVLFYAGAIVSNTIGAVGYPAAAVWRDAAVLLESFRGPAGILLLSGVGVWFWHLAIRTRGSVGRQAGEHAETTFLLLVGTLWAALAYLPFSTAFGYPRTVGLTADRINILAQWGVALGLSTLSMRLFLLLASRRSIALGAGYVGLLLVTALLLSNLYTQRESYVEAYRKEKQLARLILESPELRSHGTRTPIVLLDRKQKLVFPRAQLLKTIEDGQAVPKALGFVKFLANRYFLQEYVTSSFHLNGIMLFGCCPNSAAITFNGYARWLNRPPVTVYKNEPPLVVEEDDQVYRIGYRNTEVWAKSIGTVRAETYSKRDFVLVRLEIDESFFQLRGPLVYNECHAVKGGLNLIKCNHVS